ncbi:hypothetical protein ACGFW5_35105 [Streptomyces sp. NPDC048416]
MTAVVAVRGEVDEDEARWIVACLAASRSSTAKAPSGISDR